MLTLAKNSSIRYVTFFSLYLTQGIPAGFAFTAVINYLTFRKLDLQAISTFGAVIGLPWSIKFIWGPVIDRFQKSSMGRRRPWIIFAQLMTFLISLFMLSIVDPIVEYKAIMIIFMFQGIFMSLQDVCVDAMAIMVVPPSERGRINAFMKIGNAVGQAIGAAGLAYLLQQKGFQLAALLQSILIFVLTSIIILVKERSRDKWLSIKYTTLSDNLPTNNSLALLVKNVFYEIFKLQNIIVFGALAFIFICISLFQKVYFLHLIQKLGWSDVSISILSGTYGILIAIGLALLGGSLSDRIGAKYMLVITAFTLGILHIGFTIVISECPTNFVITTSLITRQILEILFSIAALPIIMSICRPGIEGAQFSIYMALINQADTFGVYISGNFFSRYSLLFIGISCSIIILIAAITLKITFNNKNFFTISDA